LGDAPRQDLGGLAKPVLKDDPEEDPGAPASLDQLDGARRRDLDRLFEKDVLPGLGEAPGDLEMGVGRRQDEDRVDRAVGGDGVEIARYGEGKSPGEGRAAR